MSNLIRGEFYKLKKSKYFWGFIFMSIVVSIFFISEWDRKIEYLHGTTTMFPLDGVYCLSWSFCLILLTSFLFSLFCGEFIAKDLKNNMSNSFGYGYSRIKVILSKVVVFAMVSLLLQLIYTVILVVYASVNCGFSTDWDIGTMVYLVRIIFIGLMLSIATICMIAMISIITKSTICTVISPIIVIIAYRIYVDLPGLIIIRVLFPYGAAASAIYRQASNLDVAIGIISPFLSIIITISIIILYIKQADLK